MNNNLPSYYLYTGLIMKRMMIWHLVAGVLRISLFTDHSIIPSFAIFNFLHLSIHKYVFSLCAFLT